VRITGTRNRNCQVRYCSSIDAPPGWWCSGWLRRAPGRVRARAKFLDEEREAMKTKLGKVVLAGLALMAMVQPAPAAQVVVDFEDA
jgi:hypothetical protein